MEKQNQITDIVWDADNTLWDWVTYAVHAYEAMSQCIANETGIPEPRVAAAMKRFYTDVGTMENEFMIQGLYSMGFFKEVKNFDLDKLIVKAQKVFTKVRSDNLKLYPGIEEILKQTHGQGIKNHILTDAPGFQAAMRIQHFELGGLITSVNTMPPANPHTLPKKFRAKRRRGAYKVPFIVRTVDKEKPYTTLEKILKMTRKQIRKRVRIVGDNLNKDIKLAIKYGCAGTLATYGIANQDLLRRILRFAPTKTARKNVSIEKSSNIDNLPDNIGIANNIKELAKQLSISI